jgi:CheY-like chemotaxis protein
VATVLLLIRDEPLSHALTDLLEYEGYSVIAHPSIQDALAHAATVCPEVAVMEVRQLHRTHLTFAVRLRALPGCEHARVVALSMEVDASATLATLRPYGVDAVLTKPFEPDALLEAIRQVAGDEGTR